ncbi:hypothetical protein BU25DRAFT_389235 [Macroventuria anomochaeta]|uniref:Uncharacterized protein n=1 Tax=Macroventuria anomochaeta TaxID=301207 RepID=A0ACB6S5A4_9PLEO|nr:uncharacterized protein BU25DRAFT_389235 [Macroventuria anomochaeta]KAF2629224.1 hypothetical protein BU25DRAFT_389235 [Macroventuria anomochaeta]
MDPSHQHGAYAFLPYLPSTPHADPPFFNIKHTSTWTYCGPLLTPPHLPSSLQAWSSIAVTPPSALLTRLIPLLTFLEDFLIAAGVQHYWLTLRATTPTKEYDVPRWHVDDDFFGESKKGKGAGRQSREGGWKLCTTLVGPSTLFLRQSRNAAALRILRDTKRKESEKRPHVCSSIRCAGCFDTGEAVRRTCATSFAGEDVVQAEYGEVAFFRIGEEAGAVHSEPPCGMDRLFVNIVPGTEDELRRLMCRYGMSFPRAWSLGLPSHPVSVDELRDGKYDVEIRQHDEQRTD